MKVDRYWNMFDTFVFSTVAQRVNYEKLFLAIEVGLPNSGLPVRA